MKPTPLVALCERLEAGDATMRELCLKEVDARLVRALSRPLSCLVSLTLQNIALDSDLTDALTKQTQLTKPALDSAQLDDGVCD